MAGVELQVTGADSVMTALTDAVDGIGQNTITEIQAAGQYCEQQARTYCPVLTGALQESITYQQDGDGWVCGTDIPYAWYVELGTSRMAAEPYLWPALQDAEAMLEASLALKMSA